jgi:hypothetical protein
MILDLVTGGHSLLVAIPLVRDTVIQHGLADVENVTRLDDVVKMSDDVTEAGNKLLTMVEQYPSQFATRMLLRAVQR